MSSTILLTLPHTGESKCSFLFQALENVGLCEGRKCIQSLCAVCLPMCVGVLGLPNKFVSSNTFPSRCSPALHDLSTPLSPNLSNSWCTWGQWDEYEGLRRGTYQEAFLTFKPWMLHEQIMCHIICQRVDHTYKHVHHIRRHDSRS